MKIDIQLISEEYITPSSPTAPHLRRHQLSSIDILQPPIYLPWIMFYPKDNDTTVEKCDKIKKSLSEALTLFYPLAGRIKEDAYVDCNDQGAYFVQAKANCYLSDILNRRDPNELTNFAPVDPNDSPMAVVQVTFFECSGLAVYFAMSHKVGDSSSLFMFINSWAAIARGDNNNNSITTPLFESATLFPPSKDTSRDDPPEIKDIVKVVTKRFVFNASSVATLVEKYTNNDGARRRPTRFEALSAFIWSRLRRYLPKDKPSGSASAVNLRPRMDPALSNNHFGNFVFFIGSPPSLYSPRDDDLEKEKYALVDKVREDINRVNAELVKDLQQSNSKNLEFIREILERDAAGEVTLFVFTSLTSFPTDSADFGWGKPFWVAALPLPTKNMVAFFPDQNGDGIEAWLYLKEEDVGEFLNDEEFLSYVTV